MLAAAYMLRAISATLHRDVGPAVRESSRDLRPAEIGVLAPLVAALLLLSFYPAAVSDHSFRGKPAETVIVSRLEP